MNCAKVKKKDVVVAKNETMVVSCSVSTGPTQSRLPVLFEPDVESPWPSGHEVPETLVTLRGGTSSRITIHVKNTTDHDITLKKRTMLGKLELVQSVTPLEVRKRENKERSADCIRLAKKSSEGEEVRSQSDTPVMKRCQSEVSNPTPDVDLGDLTDDQKIAVATMLREEAESFSKDDDDAGCAKGLQLKINLSDNHPVQKSYTSIPKYSEVMQYVEDLLNRGWVQKSCSLFITGGLCAEKGRFSETVRGFL